MDYFGDDIERWFHIAKGCEDPIEANLGDEVLVRHSTNKVVAKIVEVYPPNAYGAKEYYAETESGEGIYLYEYQILGKKRQEVGRSSCQCGALKTYGKSCSGLSHALYCPMRGSDESNS